MADHMIYPTEWPSHCVGRLIEIGPGGLFDRKSEALKSVLTIVSFFAGKTLGDPDAEQVIGRIPEQDMALMADDLQEFINVYSPDDIVATHDMIAKGPISNAVIERLLAIILPLLLEWLEDWLTPDIKT